MPRKGSPYGPDYQRLRKRVLAGQVRCAYCSGPATEVDHVPPLSRHDHRGSNCCHLAPSCGPCARLQGGLLRAGRWLRESPEDAETALELEPTGFDVFDAVWDVPWLEALRDVPASAVWPRLMTVPHPDAVGSLGEGFERWYHANFGLRLRWFQRLVARRLLEHDADGRLLWRTLILTMARQLGKSTLLAAILMWRLVHGFDMFGEEQLLLHTARQTDAAREVQRMARMWAKARSDEYKVIDANGKEAIEHLASRSRWLARAEDAVYGLSATTALADEAWDITTSTVDEGIEPTLIAHVQPQLLLTSTAHRRATSLMLNRRVLAVEQLDSVDDATLLVEWSAPRTSEIGDLSAWRLASPHWDVQREKDIGRKISRVLAGESVDSSEPDPVESFRSQWLNIWPVLLRRGKGDPLVDAATWNHFVDRDVDAVSELYLAVEDFVGQGAAAAGAGWTADDKIVVSGRCFDSRREAYEWVARWIDQVPGSVLLVGPRIRDDVEVGDMPAEIRPRGPVDTLSALSLLRELVAAGVIVHDGSAMSAQIVGARVTGSPTGGLQLVNAGRPDLVRCVAWAVAEAHRTGRLVPAVYGA